MSFSTDTISYDHIVCSYYKYALMRFMITLQTDNGYLVVLTLVCAFSNVNEFVML